MKIVNKKRFSITICVVCLIAAVCIYSCYSICSDIYGKSVGNKSDDMFINVPEGSGISAITDILYENGIIKYRNMFKLIAKHEKGIIYQQGTHIINADMSYKEILKILQEPPISNDNILKVMIPEGFELRQIADLMEENGISSKEDFLTEVETGKFDYDFLEDIPKRENRLEGYLFPATYEIYRGESAHNIIDKMLKKFSETVIPIYESSGTEKSLDDIIIMASIVEREAAGDVDRGKVASVFYNRIEKDMTLSSCATVQYILEERKAILSNSDIQTESGYNTYIHKGLPIGPIASPGQSAVTAALYPEETEYLFFVSDGRNNVFSVTDEEHLRNVRRIQNGS